MGHRCSFRQPGSPVLSRLSLKDDYVLGPLALRPILADSTPRFVAGIPTKFRGGEVCLRPHQGFNALILADRVSSLEPDTRFSMKRLILRFPSLLF